MFYILFASLNFGQIVQEVGTVSVIFFFAENSCRKICPYNCSFVNSSLFPVMYNGVGLATARGSGTNGFVQRNFALVRNAHQKMDYKTEEEIKKSEAALSRTPNQDILAHERKRQVEIKCFEMQEHLEEQGYAFTCICDKNFVLYAILWWVLWQ